jgi:MoxR-like ATPase
VDRSLADDLAARRTGLRRRIVGRERELDVILAAVAAGRDLLLEGPPGTSKSTILRVITDSWDLPLFFVEGNAELTPARLVGHHNPARVLREDYSAENFVAGPLVAAMRQGGFLYIEELNRAPEDTLNALLTAMAEREIEVPRVGKIHAEPQFRVVASMNPFDNVGTTRISVSFYDRLCRLAIDYQSAAEDEQIVALRTGSDDPVLVAGAVALTRATRAHPEVRSGSSVRGAIDIVAVAGTLQAVRAGDGATEQPSIPLDAALVALSARIRLHETSDRTPEDVIRELWENILLRAASHDGAGGTRWELPNPI